MKDLTGKRFGQLTVIRRIDNNKWGHIRYLCLCDCGKEGVVLGNDLKNGHTKSCGCLRKTIIHGHAKKKKHSRTYRSWAQMISRCSNPGSTHYLYYGGRGIKVCKRWLKFENFLEDMGEAPIKFQIDRIDNNKDYYKGNCQWVTSKQQARNRRNNHPETFNGKTQCLAAWAEEYNIPYFTLSSRINKLGWSIERALTTPVRKKRKK